MGAGRGAAEGRWRGGGAGGCEIFTLIAVHEQDMVVQANFPPHLLTLSLGEPYSIPDSVVPSKHYTTGVGPLSRVSLVQAGLDKNIFEFCSFWQHDFSIRVVADLAMNEPRHLSLSQTFGSAICRNDRNPCSFCRSPALPYTICTWHIGTLVMSTKLGVLHLYLGKPYYLPCHKYHSRVLVRCGHAGLP